MISSQERVTSEIGNRVRTARAQRRWTLDDLAARSTVSRRLLVQIEHADANPSLATLLKLAAALGITLNELLSEEPEAESVGVVAAEDARNLWSTPAGSAARLLVSHEAIELWSWTLAPGDRRSSEPHRPGSLELLTVQTGTLALSVRDRQVEIPAGGSAWFDATSRHVYANPGTNAATFTLVVLDPA